MKSPDGTKLATGSEDKTARIWSVSGADPSAWTTGATLTGHTNNVWSVAWSPDGTKVATGSEDKTARVWLLADGAHVRTLEGHTFGVNSVCVTPDGLHVVTGSHDETARVWSCTSGKELAMFHDDEVSNERGKPFVYDVAFSYDAITGAWVRDRAVRAARSAAGATDWSAASPQRRQRRQRLAPREDGGAQVASAVG